MRRYMKRNRVRWRLWIAALLLAIGGCSFGGGNGGGPEKSELSGEQARHLAMENLLDVRVDEHLQALAREHAHQELLLSIPGFHPGRIPVRNWPGHVAAGCWSWSVMR